MTPRSLPPASRRSVLLGGVGTAVAVLAGCSRAENATPPVAPSPPASAGGAYAGDLRVLALSAALENLAVRAYARVRTRAAAGGYGSVPPAVTAFVAAAQAQHREHAAAWNGLLSAAGRPPVTGIPVRGAASLQATLTGAASVHDLAAAAAALEVTLAQTFLAAVGTLTDPHALGLAAAVAPVEAQHAATVNLLLGSPPVPQPTLGTGSAVPPSAFTA